MTAVVPARTGSPRAAVQGVRVDPARLLRRIEELGRIGATAEGGVTRPAFSAEDRLGQRYVRAEAAAAGLHSRVDQAGNIVFTRTPGLPAEPVILVGSHLDTVVNGGRLDGAYGVLAALEVLQTVTEAGIEPRHEPVAVAFANEEGALFPQPFWGSMALAGQADRLPADPRDRDGDPLAGPLALNGGDLDDLRGAAWPPGAIRSYLELHIEQGPVLEDREVPIGVVSGIVGRRAFDVHVRGQAGHAGTTPMESRRDAAVAASHVVLAVERLATEQGLCRVATSGRLSLSPDSTNVVPGAALVAVELRDESEGRLVNAVVALEEALADIAERTGCGVRAEPTLSATPVGTDPGLRDLIASCAHDLGLESLRLASGAGHDAQIIASVAPAGMIFVPSRGGVSHAPEEDTAPADLVAGADVLLRAVLSA